MDLLRALSIAASSATLALSLVLFACASYSKWHQHERVPSTFLWGKGFWNLIIHCVVTVGLGICLLVFSIKWNERWIEIILLLFGRFLLIRQVSMQTLFMRLRAK